MIAFGVSIHFQRSENEKEKFRQSWGKYLAQFLFTTSELKLDYYHQKVNV